MSDLIEKLSDLRSKFNCFNENERDAYHTLSEAIKVLSEQPEPCEDAVSRKDVEEMLQNGFPARGMWEIEGDVVKQTVCETLADALMELEKLPSVTPKTEPQWIPATERLPEEYGNYLISIHGEDEPDIGTINPNNKRGWSLCDASGFYWASDKSLIVTAWMPFPEPYRAERRTDELEDS